MSDAMKTKYFGLPPGVYELPDDLKNPAPDGRQRWDWSKLPTWKKGSRFRVRETSVLDGYTTCEIKMEGGRGTYHYHSSIKLQWSALQKVLVPAKKSARDVLFDLGLESEHSRSEALIALMRDGKVSESDIRQIVTGWEAEEE